MKTEYPVPPAPPTKAPAPKKNLWTDLKTAVKVLLALAVVGGLLVWGAIAIGTSQRDDATTTSSPTEAPTRFELAFEGTTGQSITLGDDGASITVDGQSDDYYAFRGAMEKQFYGQVATILAALGTPDYVIQQMDSTTSLQGVVTSSWDGIEASWTYHPDNGFDLQLVDTEVTT
jgi:hypothetical protein